MVLGHENNLDYSIDMHVSPETQTSGMRGVGLSPLSLARSLGKLFDLKPNLSRFTETSLLPHSARCPERLSKDPKAPFCGSFFALCPELEVRWAP